MRLTLPSRCIHLIVLLMALGLSSCGGGTNTAGTGGSGIGGTGITTVAGNVSQVVASASEQQNRTLAGRFITTVTDMIAGPVNAQSQSDSVEDIRVIGGGRITTTNADGSFTLNDVTPSESFTLFFELPDDRSIVLPIGAVPSGSRVQVINVVLDTGLGFASAEEVRVEENAGGSPDDDSDDDDASDDDADVLDSDDDIDDDSDD